MSKKTNLDNKKIKEEILNLKKNLLNFGFQKQSGQLENTSQIKSAKKKIARLNSKLSQIKTNGDENA